MSDSNNEGLPSVNTENHEDPRVASFNELLRQFREAGDALEFPSEETYTPLDPSLSITLDQPEAEILEPQSIEELSKAYMIANETFAQLPIDK